MILEVFALQDRKAGVFGRPVFVVTMGLLVRELQDALKGEDILARHPEDFALFRLGSFDDVKGVFVLLPLPDFVLEVSSLVDVGRKPAAPLAAVS